MKKFIFLFIFAFSPLMCHEGHTLQGGGTTVIIDDHITVSSEGMVKFDDGSVWKILRKRWESVKLWRNFDVIVIELNTKSRKKNYPFRLHNLTKDEYTKARIMVGPEYDTAYFIQSVDGKGQKIHLSDETVWHVAEGDWSVAEKWKFNDTIMVGVDTTGSGKCNFLINVNTMTYVFADIYK